VTFAFQIGNFLIPELDEGVSQRSIEFFLEGDDGLLDLRVNAGHF
jgi:hypothetical protein